MLFCVGSTNNPWPQVIVHCYFSKHWDWYSAVPGQTTQVIKSNKLCYKSDEHTHTHKQAMDNALSDGQSSLGVVSGPYSSPQKVLLQRVGSATQGCPGVTE